MSILGMTTRCNMKPFGVFKESLKPRGRTILQETKPNTGFLFLVFSLFLIHKCLCQRKEQPRSRIRRLKDPTSPNLTAMPSLTKEQLVVKIKELGETPPSEWKHKQLLARYAELKELEQEKNKNGATNILTEMNKASRKKSTLQDFLQNRLAMTITGNETIPRLLALGNQRVMENTVPQDSDVMGFGHYSNMTYQEVRDYHPKYIQWCRATMSEEEVSWQMRRFMKWVEMKTKNQIMGINSKVKLQPEPRMDISKKPCEGSASSIITEDSFTEVTSASMESEPDVNHQLTEIEGQIHELQRQQALLRKQGVKAVKKDELEKV